MNSKRQDLDMVFSVFFQTGLYTSVLKYRWKETGLHGEVTETANNWNDIGS